MKSTFKKIGLALMLSLFIFLGKIEAQMSGTYTVGMGGNYLTLTAAYSALVTYGMNGPVTLSVISNLPGKQRLEGLVSGSSTTNTITITSSTGNPNSYTIGIDSMYALSISERASNIIIKDITIGVSNNSSQQYGVYFYYNNFYICDNIEFRNCNINSYTSATSSSYAGVYYDGYNSSNYYLKNVRFIKNSINGGYYNFYFDYMSGTSTNIQNKYGVLIDSNQLTNAYYSGIYTYYYGYFKSISYNKITSRIGLTTEFIGIRTYYYTTIDSIKGNIIHSTTYGSGLYLYNYQNTVSGNSSMKIYNNEIIIEASSGTIYGIYTSGSNTNFSIINNSIYLSGHTTAYGISWYTYYNYTSNSFRNNIIHINTDVPAYMFYFSYSSYSSRSYSFFDYNNYYRTGSNTTTYYGSSSYTSLSAWKTSSYNQDVYSTEVFTDFHDVTKSLELNNYAGLTCPYVSDLLTDIRNNPRSSTTYKGCYEPYNNDASIIKSAYTSSSGIVNTPFSLQVLLQNAGKNAITSASINWKFKDTLRSSIAWSGNLTSGGNAIVNLPNVILTRGYSNPFQIWSSNPNGTTDINTINDTLLLTVFGCTSVLNGYYTIGGSSADFSTIDDAIAAINICGISGPVTFALNNGSYNQSLVLTADNFIGISQENTVTFTSVSGNPDSVQLYAAGTTLTLDSVSHLRFKDITIGINSPICEKAVVFKRSCSDIDFRNCILNVDTLSSNTKYVGVCYENSTSGTYYITNINFINNTINGGYYNFYFYYAAGSASNLTSSGMSVIIDSNRLKNSYYMGLYSYIYARYPSVSYNIITPRNTEYVNSYWTGLNFSVYQNVNKIIGNKIYSFNENISYPIGIYAYNYFNSTSYYGDGTGYIINNEIILKGNSSSSYTNFIGIGLEYVYADIEIYHNSIYLHGLYSGSNYGYCLDVVLASTSYKYKIMNNNLASSTISSSNYIHPIYCSFSNTNCIRNYNNYYNSISSTVARIASSSYSLTSLRSNFSLDPNSINVNCGFTSGVTSLYPTTWLSCPILSVAPYDITGVPRLLSKTTYMGCYHPNYQNDAGVVEFTNVGLKSTVGINPIKVLIRNYGKDTLKSVYVNYSINGTLQTPVALNGLQLPQYKDTVVTIGSFVATLAVTTTLKAWTSYPNGVSDAFIQNDTTTLSTTGCSLVLNGTYDVAGGNNNFTSLGAAIAALNSCGVSGNVVLRLASGSYDSLSSISTIYFGSSATKTVTFTSLANNADSVTIGALTGTALTLNGAAYLRFEKLTIGNNIATTYGVNFINTNQNIEFNKCTINSHASIARTGYACVNFNNTDTSKTLKNVRFTGNVLKGGYYNFFFNNAGGSAFNVSFMSVNIDSNQLLQSYYYGLYSNKYAYFNSISNNTIKARTSDSLSYFWYGMYFSAKNSADKITNNRIQSTNTSLAYPNGIFIDSNFNCYGTLNYYPIIANNEIMLTTVGQVNGISINVPNSYIQLIHNSVYMYGTGSPNALYLNNPSTTYLPVIKNNLLMTNANTLSFPIYYQGNYSTSYYVCNYNDYYSSGSYIGYAGGAKNTLTTLRTATGQDANSVNVLPAFYNLSTGLEYKDTINLKCTGLSNLTYDINGKYRGTSTLIGAYDISKVDLAISSFISPSANQKVCQYSSQDVRVSVSNIGNENVSFSARPLHLYLSISGAITYQKDTIINTGGLQALQSMNVGFIPTVSLTNSGQCNVKVFIDYLDYNKINDTLKTSITIIPRNTKDTLTICSSELPLHYGDSIFYASGNYAVSFHSFYGCDSIVSLCLYVNPTYTRNDTITICQNQVPYHYGDSTFSLAGSYSVYFKTKKGCDSLVVLRLYVNPTYSKTDTITICQSQLPYHYGDSTMNAAGSFNVHFKTKKGCDSLVVLRLYVNPTYSRNDTITICQSQLPYHYGDSTMNAAGSYNVHFKTIKACDSLIVLRLYVNPTYTRNDTITICQNQIPYHYGDSTFSLAGSYSVHFKTKKGCDSLVVLRLYINPTYSRNDTITICQSQLPYKYGDSTMNVAGSCNVHFKSKKGCDSLVVLRLYVNPTYSKTDTITICQSQLPYKYGDSTMNAAGSYTIHFKTKKGCDSLVVLRLYVNPTYSKNDTVTICQNQLPYHYGDSTFTFAGSYNILFKTIKGCDSLVVLRLYVNPTYSKTDTITICQNQLPYKYGDSTMNAAGSCNVHFKTIKGCDSLVVLRLYVNPTYSKTDTVTICQNQLPYHYGDSTITVSGSYNVHFKTKKGCDSLVVLRLYVNPTYTKNDTVTICQSQLPYKYGDSTMNAAGSYAIHFKTKKGCDSLVVLRLYVNPTYSRNDTVTICQTQLPYKYGDSTMNNGGSFNVYFKTKKGCDSVVVLRLFVNPIYSKTDTVSICQNQIPYHYGDSIFYLSGSYNVRFKTKKGCDSLVVLRLYVYPTYNHTDTITLCSSQLPYKYGDSTLTTSGNFNIHFTTKKSCDSLVRLTLFIDTIFKVNKTVTLCDNELPYHFGGNTYYNSGNYDVIFHAIGGCDTVVNLKLTVNATYLRKDTLTICNNEFPYHFGDSLLTTAGNYNVHLTSSKGCDSLILLTLYAIPTYSKNDTLTICQSQLPYHYGDSILTTAGMFNIHFKTKKGCDSLVILRMYVNPIYSKTDTLTICLNQLPYHYGDSILTSPGNYSIHFKTKKGCDSLIMLRLYVYPTYSKTDTLTICQNQLPYHYGDSILKIAGSYTIHFKSKKGCDSLVVLRLYVNSSYTNNDTITICANQLPYHYGDSILYNAGNYTIHFTTKTGCDSLVKLVLYLDTYYQVNKTITVCDNELPYHFGDSTFYTAGKYQIRFASVSSCDTIINLTLTVNLTYRNPDTVTVCSNQLPYRYGNSTFTTAGNYDVPFTSIKGCDSIIALKLYVNPSITKKDTVSICNNELPYQYGDSIFTLAGDYNVYFKNLSGCDSLVKLKLTVVKVPSISGKIVGDTLITSANIYTYSVDPVEDASSYIWTLFNTDWVGNSTIESIDIYIPKGGDGMMSVKAQNKCGISKASTLTVHSTISIDEVENYSWSLGQNIPNPTSLTTIIPYFVPKEGDILLNIISVNGQVLYTEKQHVNSGNHYIEFNTNVLSEGIYFYSMTFEGQRIVKKMTIQR